MKGEIGSTWFFVEAGLGTLSEIEHEWSVYDRLAAFALLNLRHRQREQAELDRERNTKRRKRD